MQGIEFTLAIIITITVALLIVLALRPEFTREPQGKALAFVGLFLLPALTLWTGTSVHIERSKKTEFCLSCHVMEDHGKSLYVDDNEFLAAIHYQNNMVPADKACFTCHTSYTMYGDLTAKLRGMRHVFVNYIGGAPEELELYTPYQNRECLHCHENARGFLEDSAHSEEDTTMASMLAGRMSCMELGCHDVAHGIDEFEDVDFWERPRP